MNGGKRTKKLNVFLLATIILMGILAFAWFWSIEQMITMPNGLHYGNSGEYHLLVQTFDAKGKLISQKYHTLSETTYGRNQIKQLLANQTNFGLDYMACSNSTSSPNAASTTLTQELTAGNWSSGTARAFGTTYVDSGTGTWNMTFSFTAAPGVTVDTRLYGIHSQSSGANLCLYEEQDPTYQHLNAGQTLNATLMGTVN